MIGVSARGLAVIDARLIFLALLGVLLALVVADALVVAGVVGAQADEPARLLAPFRWGPGLSAAV